jgi:KaiC/GvpD/RAD55 family RecA-like ATPase
MNPRLIPVDIPGLDLALGGGIWAVKRLPDAHESTNLLIRGPPGSGKTVFGTQLAGALGRALGGDVAYGCVELLPVELQAQYNNLRGGQAQERVVVPPFGGTARADGAACRIFAGLLDLGQSGQEQERLGPAVLSLLDDVKRAGGNPRVLVVDSLSDGYGLSHSAPRVLADNLCKLAIERGLMLILLEESADSRLSPWSFAADVVMELSGADEDRSVGTPAERRLTVLKNRFGPSDAGPHFVEVAPPGLILLPRFAAYFTPWAQPLLGGPDDWLSPKDQDWSVAVTPITGARSMVGSVEFRGAVTAVSGLDASRVFEAARVLGSKRKDGQLVSGITLFVDFSRYDGDPLRDEAQPTSSTWSIGAGNPFRSTYQPLAALRAALTRCRREGLVVEKVLIGDLHSVQSLANQPALRRLAAAMTALLRQVRIPAVVFETTEAHGTRPGITELADVWVDLHRQPPTDPLGGTLLGLRAAWYASWSLL